MRSICTRDIQAKKEVNCMKQYMAVSPDISDPLLLEFARYIGRQNEIRMPARVPKVAAYSDDLELLEVPRLLHPNAGIKMCWFNCRDYVQSHPGSEIVFGWQVESMHHNNESYGCGAFPHAIVRQNNELVDITPFEVGNDEPSILFIPDSRVPFDYEGLRRPFSLFWSLVPMLKPFWTSDTEYPNEHRQDTYGVGKPSALEQAT